MNINNYNFKNYLKCNNYITLEQIYLKKKSANISLSENEFNYILSKMFYPDGSSNISNKLFDSKNFSFLKTNFQNFINKTCINNISFDTTITIQKNQYNFECLYDCFIEDDDNIIIIKLSTLTEKSFFRHSKKKNTSASLTNISKFTNIKKISILNPSGISFISDLHFYKFVFEQSQFFNPHKNIHYLITILNEATDSFFEVLDLTDSLKINYSSFVDQLLSISSKKYCRNICLDRECKFFSICNIDTYKVVEKEFINATKLDAEINKLKYPICYLDFESYSSIFPRFSNELPYSNHVFMYSLIIENEDHSITYKNYIAKNSIEDFRYQLFSSLIRDIPLEGSIIVYNDSFEKNRIKEASIMFPDLFENLVSINKRIFDLLYILKGNKSTKNINPENNNYYNTLQNNSYSIKSLAPLFNCIDYNSMKITKGTEASFLYSLLDSYTDEEADNIKKSLIEYCNTDCYNMYIILNSIKRKIKEH